jgi:hypothetical protein
MSAALKFEPLENSQLRPSHLEPTQRRRLTVVSTPSSPVAFPPTGDRERPAWLRILVAGQRVSLIVAGVTVTAAVAAYAMTVDANRRLTLATATLGRLQDHQQQLITANAVFKNHLAQTAITAMNDGTLHPKDVIFLEAAEPAAEPTLTVPETPSEATRRDRRFFPKGY